jgi:hypothetical protein
MAQTAIKIYSKKITPTEAQQYLEKTNHKKNRKLAERNVSFLLGEMQAGNWITTGDPIQFNKDGELINGQHRLTAIVRYGKPVELFVAENVPNEAFKVMDTGKMRSAGDTLRISGHKAAYTMASTVRIILLVKSGRYDSRSGRHKNCSNTDILAFADANKKHLDEVIHEGYVAYGKFKFAPPSMLGALYYFFEKKDSKKCFEFFEKYATGIDLGATNPILKLREKLIQNKANKTKYTDKDIMALHVYAWNAFREGKKVTNLALANKYEFPKIK